ncbi:DNA polymerase III subunit alpha [Alkalihalobacillus sp. LMS39]|uniref:DNA polymerase III subunit alpha n=1 Tax=Alkalihalobacillus sp. LMS39 TaxID=2924032 RepID=UPI001FB3131E|nr:DNA polymerase III subunit alpha [Alkalihalobacillus sp. LMS39]UOE93428.1 DNA polymerase III subunit alpha [Alkalihalobacillus sp. LMS39]
MAFAHLHIHSEYSLLSGVCRIKDLVLSAKEKGISALALTDKNVVYGLIPFYKLCLEHGIKPIVGLELDVVHKNDTAYNLETSKVVVLAKNNKGYEHLLALSTKAQMGRYRTPAIDKETLWAYKEELLVILPFEDGELSKAIFQQQYDEATNVIQQFIHQVGVENIFIELQLHEKRDIQMVEELYTQAKKHQVRVVATNHVHFLEKEDAMAYETVQAIRLGEPIDSNIKEEKTLQYYLKAKDEMTSLFKAVPEAIQHTIDIANMCHVELHFHQHLLPKYPLPDKQMTAHEYLQHLCKKEVQIRYPNESKVYQRLEYELDVIASMNFSDYFLIVWDFMKFARENGIMTGPGRGSAAGSLVAYLLNITKVDPIRYDLLFERFLNPERISMPDIDIDFSDQRRDEVIEYVKQKYSKNNVAQIITFGTLAAKAAIRDVGKALVIDQAIIDKLAKQIPSAPGMTLQKALRESKDMKALIERSEQAQLLFETAKKVEGLPRHTSTHAAGIVISEKPLLQSVALQPGQEDMALTQYPMAILEEIGLLKMDFLGLRNLTLIEEIVSLIQSYEKVDVDIDKIDMSDEKTYQLLSRGETTGVFQLESEGMRQVLKKLGPTEFEDIVAVNALYRPGPMQFIDDYIDRKHGKKQPYYIHPHMQPILEKTYGVMIYQEQIMKIASSMAGFSLGEADLLRRAVSKKKREDLEHQRAKFIAGAIQSGYSESSANEVYDQIVRFSNYGFNRSHAVAYSVIAYQLAYLKAHYPHAFYAALLTSVSYHDQKLLQYIREANRVRIKVLPPSINNSSVHFGLENGSIRFGFQAIKHVGIKAAYEIIKKRQKSSYKDLYDFCSRVDVKTVSKKTIEVLIISGCFDECGYHRAQLLASLDDVLTYCDELKKTSEGVGQLFSIDEGKKPYDDVPPFTDKEKLRFEKEVVGFYLSGHPITAFQSILQDYNIQDLALIEPIPKKQRIAGLVEQVRKVKTKKGDDMLFVLVSDETGEIDITVFPKVFEQYKQQLLEGQLVFFEGRAEARNEKRTFIAEKLCLVEKLPPKAKETLFLKIPSQYESNQILQEVKEVITTFPGQAEVILYYEREQQYKKLSKHYFVQLENECLSSLKRILGEGNVVVKKE